MSDTQVVILCGGKGTRLGDVTQGVIPKPMVQVGPYPILYHVMKGYEAFGHRRFVLCAGHLSWSIKEYFLHLQYRNSNLTIRTAARDGVELFDSDSSVDWEVRIVDTGEETQTAGRIWRVGHVLDDADFMLTYGDGVSDVDLTGLDAFHRAHGKALTITGVAPPGRFGEFNLEGDQVTEMREKPENTGRYINGGFMMLKRDFLDRFIGPEADEVMLERAPFEDAAEAGEMMIFRHDGFWQCMDTARDWDYLNGLWSKGTPPWPH